MQLPDWIEVPGLNEPEWKGDVDLALSLDPGDNTGWCLARVLPNELRVIALGTGTPIATLALVRGVSMRIAHLIVEEPARRGTPEMQRLFGMFLEAVHAQAKRHLLELHVVRPTEWKQYPLRKRREAETLLTTNSGDLVPRSRHEKDALGMLAWWYLVSGKELVHGGRVS